MVLEGKLQTVTTQNYKNKEKEKGKKRD